MQGRWAGHDNGFLGRLHYLTLQVGTFSSGRLPDIFGGKDDGYTPAEAAEPDTQGLPDGDRLVL
jgi:hypothetical protein